MSKNIVIKMKGSLDKEIGSQRIIKWYKPHLEYFLDEYSDGKGNMTYNTSTNLYEISFTPNEDWPRALEDQHQVADTLLGDPDTDGNYPIDEYLVVSEIVSIDGQKMV